MDAPTMPPPAIPTLKGEAPPWVRGSQAAELAARRFASTSRRRDFNFYPLRLTAAKLYSAPSAAALERVNGFVREGSQAIPKADSFETAGVYFVEKRR